MSCEDPEEETLIELITRNDLETLWRFVEPTAPLPNTPRVFLERLQQRMLSLAALDARADQWLRLAQERHRQILEAQSEMLRIRAHNAGLESQVAALVTLCKEHKLL